MVSCSVSSVLFAHHLSLQIRYPVTNQPRSVNTRYRMTGPGMMAGGFNQKGPQRVVNKPKKPKSKKDEKKSNGDEDEAEKKTILKDGGDEKKDDKTENG